MPVNATTMPPQAVDTTYTTSTKVWDWMLKSASRHIRISPRCEGQRRIALVLADTMPANITSKSSPGGRHHTTTSTEV